MQLWNNGANCWRGITIQANGKQVNAAIVDLVSYIRIITSRYELTDDIVSWLRVRLSRPGSCSVPAIQQP